MPSVQRDLFLPMCARIDGRQGRLFDEAAAVDADSDLTCAECGCQLVRTDGYLACPKGHGRLVEIAPDPIGSWFDTDPETEG